MNLAISLLTCNKPELVARSAKPLLDGAVANKYHLFVIDGSTEANQKAIWDLTWPAGHMHANVRGGAGAAIVYALSMMLAHKEHYSHVALVESDVLLLDGWLDCLDLFDLGRTVGLEVGAVSARCYVDRVLFQEDRFAVMHNLGAGMLVLTREAAQIVLDTFRTAWSTDNRRIFCQLAGVDIGSFWAFRTNEHVLTADWHWEAALAACGLAALALTPSPVEMIGQNPPLAEQGLEIAAGPVEARRNDAALKFYANQLARVGAASSDKLALAVDIRFHFDPNTGTQTIFPHQMAMIGGKYSGDWRLQEARGWGTFAWVAAPLYGDVMGNIGFKNKSINQLGSDAVIPQGLGGEPSLGVSVFGPCAVLVSGGKSGGKIEVMDEHSGFKASPTLPPESSNGVLQLMMPSGINYRPIRLTALTPGVVFYGIQTREKQPFLPNISFNYSTLPTP